MSERDPAWRPDLFKSLLVVYIFLANFCYQTTADLCMSLGARRHPKVPPLPEAVAESPSQKPVVKGPLAVLQASTKD